MFLFIALVPFLFLFKMQKRERAWIIGLTAIYFCVGILLTMLMNTSPDRQSADENKVFFTASHAMVAILIGYGLALLSAYMATHYGKFRLWGLSGGAIAAVLGLIGLWQATGRHYFGPGRPDQPLRTAALDCPGLCQGPIQPADFCQSDSGGAAVYFHSGLLIYRQRAPMLITLGLFAAMPVYSGLAHWAKSEQRNHWFGYWFGHDMFTPPFVGPDGKFSYDPKLREQTMKGPNGDLVYPEMTRDTILFGGTDPGRFCSDLHDLLREFHPAEGQADGPEFRPPRRLSHHAKRAGRRHLSGLSPRRNISAAQQQDPPFFSRLFKYTAALAGMVTAGSIATQGDLGSGNSGSALIEGIANLLYATLDKPFTERGAKIEARWRKEGVYPPKEIYIPSPEDSQAVFPGIHDETLSAAPAGGPAPAGRRRAGGSGQRPGAGFRAGRRDDDQRPALPGHFRPQPDQRILRRGKFPARMDVSLRDAVRHHHEDQPQSAA